MVYKLGFGMVGQGHAFRTGLLGGGVGSFALVEFFFCARSPRPVVKLFVD
jgi:hypothetical protein